MDTSKAQFKTKVVGYGNNHSFTWLGPIEVERKEPRADEVAIEILYCGVCHSDLHQANNDWGNTIYPCVPGHEIVGRVMAKGAEVSKFEIGDNVGVGCMVDSCGVCENCVEGLEQYCEGPVGPTLTYNGPAKPDGTNTFGGYSESIVVREDFVLRIPSNLPLEAVAPILCAGVTTYSPLKHWDVQPGQTVGVIGFGGLGHMATKLAKSLGAEVTVLSTSPEKKEDAIRCGAEHFVDVENDDLDALELKFDLMIDTIPYAHDINRFVKMLRRDGTIAVVGLLLPFAAATNNQEVAFHRRSVAGSLIGSIAETQEVLDYCGKNDITPDIELIEMKDINDALKRVKAGKARYRYVIDIQNTIPRQI